MGRLWDCGGAEIRQRNGLAEEWSGRFFCLGIPWQGDGQTGLTTEPSEVNRSAAEIAEGNADSRRLPAGQARRSQPRC